MRQNPREEYQSGSGFPLIREASIHLEEGPRMCGLAVVRSILDYQFELNLSEEQVIDRFCDLTGYEGTSATNPERIRRSKRFFCEYAPGYFPSQIAKLIRQEVPQSLKVFCSRRGTIKHLDHLLLEEKVLPITHQMVAYDEEGSTDPSSHYMFYCGFNGSEVRYFDPSIEEGFKVVSAEQFMQQWQNPECGNERWYMAILPQEVRLNRRIFNGKYM